MLLSSLDIHRLNVSRTTLVCLLLFLAINLLLCYCSSVVERRTCNRKITGLNPCRGNYLTNIYHSSVLFSGIKHLLEISFSVLKFFAILAVANSANINSNEQFCLVGYSYQTCTCTQFKFIHLFVCHSKYISTSEQNYNNKHSLQCDDTFYCIKHVLCTPDEKNQKNRNKLFKNYII